MTYTEDQLTEWYPPNVKPVRVGVYQRDYGNEIRYCYWDGYCFMCGSLELSDLFIFINDRSLKQKLKWRGLKEKPE